MLVVGCCREQDRACVLPHCPSLGLDKEIGTYDCDLSTDEAMGPTSAWGLRRPCRHQKEDILDEETEAEVFRSPSSEPLYLAWGAVIKHLSVCVADAAPHPDLLVWGCTLSED